jgi:DNA polymerase
VILFQPNEGINLKLFEKPQDLTNLTYEEVKAIAGKCTKCPLSEGRTNVVFGHGRVPCNLMLIGEGPGEQEDLQGLPFVGRAGQLLTKILESVEISREKDIYITNIVKCRPPGNRAPLSNETEACFPYLEAQIQIIKPKIILLAGAPSTKVVLGKTEPMSKMRGQWFKLPGTDISVMPIFHPSYLLRNPSKNKGTPKWLTWQDMQEVRNALDCIKKVEALSENKK